MLELVKRHSVRPSEAQDVLVALQVHRAAKRQVDPCNPVLEAIELLDAAASNLESPNPQPWSKGAVEALRATVNLLLEQEVTRRKWWDLHVKHDLLPNLRPTAPAAE